MPERLAYVCPLLAAIALAVACESNNPSRPSVSFVAPATTSPANAVAFNHTQQPITLTVTNAARTGVASVTYDVEVSASPAFATFVFSVSGVAEGSGSTTSVTLPVLAGNTTYYWRSRAKVDGVAGEPSATSSFFVRPQVVLQPPGPVTPTAGDPVFEPRPTFTVANASRTGQPTAVTYEFQVSTSAAFGSLAASGVVAEQPTRTSWTPGVDLPEGALHWRARALDGGSGAVSSFSPVVPFERRTGGGSGDQIDLSKAIIVLGPSNIGTWPATGTVTSTVAVPTQVCIDHDKLGSWPGTDFFDDPGTLTQGNQWMFAFIGGRWHGGAGRWYRPGQACKGTTNAGDFFGGTFYMDAAEPLRSYVPRPGDLIGLMSSTPARFYPSMRTVDERTNVVLVRFSG